MVAGAYRSNTFTTGAFDILHAIFGSSSLYLHFVLKRRDRHEEVFDPDNNSYHILRIFLP
jgi:hypothetical protein